MLCSNLGHLNKDPKLIFLFPRLTFCVFLLVLPNPRRLTSQGLPLEHPQARKIMGNEEDGSETKTNASQRKRGQHYSTIDFDHSDVLSVNRNFVEFLFLTRRWIPATPGDWFHGRLKALDIPQPFCTRASPCWMEQTEAREPQKTLEEHL